MEDTTQVKIWVGKKLQQLEEDLKESIFQESNAIRKKIDKIY